MPVRRWIPDSVSWARLEEAGQFPLARLLGPPATSQSHGGGKDVENNGQGCGDSDKGTRDAGVVEGGRRDTSEEVLAAHGEREGISKEGESSDEAKGDQGHVGRRGAGTEGVGLAAVLGGEKGDETESRTGEPLYLHDWSLPQNLGSDCSILKSFQVWLRRSTVGGVVTRRGTSFTEGDSAADMWALEHTVVRSIFFSPRIGVGFLRGPWFISSHFAAMLRHAALPCRDGVFEHLQDHRKRIV